MWHTGNPRATDERQAPPARASASGGPASAAPEEQARTWAARGYAALALELPGKGRGREKVRSTGPDWTDEALASPSATLNPLHASVVAVITSVTLLAAQPEVDARRIGLVGEGWGGVVAALAGAVDDRPQALVLARAAGGLERGPLAEALKKLSAKDREAWTKAYEPDSYARADQPPTLFVQPLQATEPSLTAVMATFRQRSGTKALALIPPDAKDGEAVTEDDLAGDPPAGRGAAAGDPLVEGGWRWRGSPDRREAGAALGGRLLRRG